MNDQPVQFRGQNPVLTGLKPSGERDPQPLPGTALPQGQTIVSADSHWEVSDDIFHDRFPAALKEKAPRVWFDRYWHIGYRGEMEVAGVSDTLGDAIERCVPDGVWDGALRAAHMAIEGISKEIVFPQSLLGFIRYRDFEVQEWVYRVYNEYIAEISAASEGRFHGVGVFSNWWDLTQVERAMQQIVDLGLKTFILPISPGKDLDGKDINYAAPAMDRLWSTIADGGMPANFHIGENAFIQEGPGALGTYLLTQFAPFRKPFGQLIFGGVFDRHPTLRIVFSEGGISWVPPALQDAEMIFDSFGEILSPLKERPSHYWHNNCFATFQNDPLGLKLIDDIGRGRALWASDYPHTEGSFGYGWNSMQSVIDAVGIDDAGKILGGTAMQLYGL